MAEEVINVQIFCGTLIAKSINNYGMIDTRQADEQANELIEGAKRYKDNVFNGLSDIEIDITDALELMLSLRRIGVKTLEQKFEPREPDRKAPNFHRPIEASPVLKKVCDLATKASEKISSNELKALSTSNLKIMIATTDEHEYC